jgi:hypothetical protein
MNEMGNDSDAVMPEKLINKDKRKSYLYYELLRCVR